MEQPPPDSNLPDGSVSTQGFDYSSQRSLMEPEPFNFAYQDDVLSTQEPSYDSAQPDLESDPLFPYLPNDAWFTQEPDSFSTSAFGDTAVRRWDPDLPADPASAADYSNSSALHIQLDVEDTVISVSSTFHFEFTYEGRSCDLTLVSTDTVQFCICSEALLESSTNMFGHFLPAPRGTTISVPLASNTLNILLHAVYHLSPAVYAPSIGDIASAVAAMDVFGLCPAKLITPKSALFDAVVRGALTSPVDAFALAASAQLEELAVAVSSYTLSTPLSDLTDEIAVKIGPRYLKRLFFLHLGRLDAFKRLVFPPPGPHPPMDKCSLADQRAMARAWTMAVASLTWKPDPGLSVASIEAAMLPIGEQQTCATCREILQRRLRKLLVEWSLVNRTI